MGGVRNPTTLVVGRVWDLAKKIDLVADDWLGRDEAACERIAAHGYATVRACHMFAHVRANSSAYSPGTCPKEGGVVIRRQSGFGVLEWRRRHARASVLSLWSRISMGVNSTVT